MEQIRADGQTGARNKRPFFLKFVMRMPHARRISWGGRMETGRQAGARRGRIRTRPDDDLKQGA
jgi:hypothetical protein